MHGLPKKASKCSFWRVTTTLTNWGSATAALTCSLPRGGDLALLMQSADTWVSVMQHSCQQHAGADVAAVADQLGWAHRCCCCARFLQPCSSQSFASCFEGSIHRDCSRCDSSLRSGLVLLLASLERDSRWCCCCSLRFGLSRLDHCLNRDHNHAQHCCGLLCAMSLGLGLNY